MDEIILYGVDIAHLRLVDLTKLADQAKPFYDWVEVTFQHTLQNMLSLNDALQTISQENLERCIFACYLPTDLSEVPLLFDGIGRSYTHQKACYYFFAWLIRDAPQQRLSPLIQRIMRHPNNAGASRRKLEIEVLAALILKYRENVKTFTWEAVREVIIDRLEGSRRSIKGREKEIVVRTALLTALQRYFTAHGNYGDHYNRAEISDRQIMIDNESYDVSVNLFDETETTIRQILVPIKTRETEGGGHAHLFSRDISSAIRAARQHNPHDLIYVVIIAKNWSRRETDQLKNMVDHLSVFDLNPGEFHIFTDEEQQRLNGFITAVLENRINSDGK